jgi:hypothetical protein
MLARDEIVRAELRANVSVLAQTLATLQSAVAQLRTDVDKLMAKSDGGDVSV